MIHHFDHRGLAGKFLELLDVIQELNHINLALGGLSRILDAIALLDGLVNFRGDADKGGDLLAGEQCQCIQHITVLGVGHDHAHAVILFFEDQCTVLLQELVRDLIIDG